MEATRTISLSLCCPIERSTSATLQLERVVTKGSTPQLEEIATEAIVRESYTPQIEEIITEDGILCSMLSSLTLIEAVRTSVLSPRWRYLWTHRTKFYFNAINMLDFNTLRGHPLCGQEAYELTKGMAPKFIRSVDLVLQHLQGVRIDTFSVKFFLDETHSQHIDEWVRFAFASDIRFLRLHLYKPPSNIWVEPYVFPCDLLESSSLSLEKLSLFFCSLNLPRDFHGLRHLKQLALIDVDISQEDFNCILSNCYSTLYKLGVWGAPQLVSISSPHPLCQLQYLAVQDCNNLRKIDINAVNLIKLEYSGFPVDFRFRHSSKLTDSHICFQTEGNRIQDFYLAKLPSSLLYLQSLTLRASCDSKVFDLPKGVTKFTRLKHLDWEWNDNVKMSLLHLTTLLNIAPFLEELKLSLLERVLEQPVQTPSEFREMIHKRHHTHLKKIQINGFYFDMWQIEIAAYLLNSATELESMTIVSKEVHKRGSEILTQEAPVNVKFEVL